MENQNITILLDVECTKQDREFERELADEALLGESFRGDESYVPVSERQNRDTEK